MAMYWDPFRELDRLAAGMLDSRQGPRVMPIDLHRDGDHYVLSADLPGVDPGSIDIDVEDRTMTIRAERRTEVDDDAQWLSHERPSGTFARQLTLGYGVALDKIDADYADGVLTLRIPVAEEAKPRKISVSHGSSRQTIESHTTDGEG